LKLSQEIHYINSWLHPLHRTIADKLTQVYIFNQSHTTLVFTNLLTAICFVSNCQPSSASHRLIW